MYLDDMIAWEERRAGRKRHCIGMEAARHVRTPGARAHQGGFGARVWCTHLSAAINNYDDIIDSRDVIERRAELEALRNDEGLDSDEADELQALESLAAEGESNAEDWQYGATLIRDSYFMEYAQNLAEDVASTREEAEFIRHGGDHWPLTCASIDWERAARELKMYYTPIEFDGVTYWVL